MYPFPQANLEHVAVLIPPKNKRGMPIIWQINYDIYPGTVYSMYPFPPANLKYFSISEL